MYDIGLIDRPWNMPRWYYANDTCTCHDDPDQCSSCRPYMIEEKDYD